MKIITANFKIIDNIGCNYESTIEIKNPETYNTIYEIQKKITQVYNVKIEQIIKIDNINESNHY